MRSDDNNAKPIVGYATNAIEPPSRPHGRIIAGVLLAFIAVSASAEGIRLYVVDQIGKASQDVMASLAAGMFGPVCFLTTLFCAVIGLVIAPKKLAASATSKSQIRLIFWTRLALIASLLAWLGFFLIGEVVFAR